MINALIRWSLRNRLAVAAVSLILMATGAWFTLRMPVDVFPDLTAPTVTVVVEGHGMATQELETLVTFPIETAVNGAAHVRRVRSATGVGISVVWVEFDWGTEIYRARQTVTERLATVSGQLPEQVEPPVLAPVSSVMGEILFVGLTSQQHDGLALRTVAGTQMQRRLLSVAGVSQVSLIGGDVKQYQVVLSTQRLKAFRISMGEVADVLRDSNENVSAGFLVEGGTESVLRGIGRIRTTEDIATTVVAAREGRAITVGDLGVVQIGSAIRRGAGSVSVRDADWNAITESGVILAILKQPTANTLELTQQLDLVLDEIQDGLPAGMKVHKQLFRQADFIQHSIHNTTAALIEGGLMVLLIVVLFLASVRSSLITLLAIPMSLTSAVLVMKLFGASINTMTLGGMAIAIGALVDDAIIDVENVVRRLRENRARPEGQRRKVMEVIFDASVEVRTSIVFATFIILLVFTPLFFLSGVEGLLLRPLGIAFCVSLAASLITALTLTPALCFYLLPSSKTVNRDREPAVVTLLKRIYAPPLRWVLRHPLLVTVPTLLLLVIAISGVARMGKNFLPEFNEGALVVGLVTLPGTALDESDRLARLVETTLMKHPEIVAIGRRTGRAESDEHVQGVEASEIDLTLDMSAAERFGQPRRTKTELLDALRQDLAMIPGVVATMGQPISHRIDHMLSGTRANLAVKIFGPDLPTLRRLAEEVKGAMQGIPGVVDLSAEQQVEVPQMRVTYRRKAMARHGVSIADAAAALDAAYRGKVATQVLEGANTYDLTVRLQDGLVATPASVGEILVHTDAGYQVPLKTLASIDPDLGPNFIMRENVQRRIVVMCNVSGRDTSSVVADTRGAIEEQVDLPQGYHVQYGGQFESAEATNQRLALLSVLVILGIGFLLQIMFRSTKDALLIMINLPLALIGGALGAWLAGGVISVATIIGFISVFGIAARNGIMLVSHVRHLQKHEGVADFAEAVRRGAMERLAPILMTALAAGLALIPIALRGEEPGTEILTPMAFVILFGLLSSTFLNMLVVPALLLRFAKPIRVAPAMLLGLLVVPACAQVEPEADLQRTRELIADSTGRSEVYDPASPALGTEEIDAILDDGLSLDEALRLALVHNLELQAEFAEIGVAHADWVQSGMLANPSLDMLLRFPQDGGRSMIEAILGIDLLQFWRIPLREEAARLDLDAAVYRIARSAGQRLAATRAVYFAAVAADGQRLIAERDLDLTADLLQAAKDLHQAGAAGAREESNALGPHLAAQLALRQARSAAATARRELAKLLSLPSAVDDLVLIDALPTPVSTKALEPEGLVELALSARLDLRAHLAVLDALAARQGLEGRRRWGDLTLGPTMERPALRGDTLIGASAGWTFPLFDRNQAQIARAGFRLEQMVLLYLAAQVRVAQNVRGATARLNTALTNLAFSADEVISQAERSLELAQDSFDLGHITRVEVLVARRQLLAARRGHLELSLEAAAALADLEVLVGAPYSTD